MKLVDVRGRRCPMLLADLTRQMRASDGGLVLEILTDRQSTVDDLVSWCRQQQHRLVSIDVLDGDVRVFIRQGRRISDASAARA